MRSRTYASSEEHNSRVLDDPRVRSQLDPKGMLHLVETFGGQCREAIQIAGFYDAGVRRGPIRSVVVTGLGGSAIGGDMLRSVVAPHCDVPIVVNRDYTLPGFVGPDTLVLAVSYSGNTEETLSAYTVARQRRAHVVCITSGGELWRRAEADRVPAIRVPAGPPPRAATGYLFFPMVHVLEHSGVLEHSLAGDAEETAGLLEELAAEWGPDVELEVNPAKKVAASLFRRVPVIYGTLDYAGVAALRWKTQINENAKSHAFAGAFPEMNHNEILAWQEPSRQARRWTVVYLRDADEESTTPRIARRVAVTRRLIGRKVPQIDVHSRGRSLMARLFSLMYFGDFTSCYLALLYREDPTVIPGIDRLKAELSRLKVPL
ncbi:MAG: bifunctional phosphoglucose/phosphomannose isomerase [Chthonomonadales bacterium]